MNLSIIIPTLNEAKILPSTLEHLTSLSPHEIILADGGSTDGTVELAHESGVNVLEGPCGRGTQMNTGAEAATGDLLLFLHADNRLSPEGVQKMLKVMQDPDILGGAFSLQIDSPHPLLKLVSRIATWRSRFLNMAYGDQAIFVRRATFHEMGGYHPLPICEDLEFFRRLASKGKVVILRDKTWSSARRWNSEGIVYTTLRNWTLATAFLSGISAKRLSRWYPTKR